MKVESSIFFGGSFLQALTSEDIQDIKMIVTRNRSATNKQLIKICVIIKTPLLNILKRVALCSLREGEFR